MESCAVQTPHRPQDSWSDRLTDSYVPWTRHGTTSAYSISCPRLGLLTYPGPPLLLTGLAKNLISFSKRSCPRAASSPPLCPLPAEWSRQVSSIPVLHTWENHIIESLPKKKNPPWHKPIWFEERTPHRKAPVVCHGDTQNGPSSCSVFGSTLILLDLSAAFYPVNHHILLSHVPDLNLTYLGVATRWASATSPLGSPKDWCWVCSSLPGQMILLHGFLFCCYADDTQLCPSELDRFYSYPGWRS